MNQEMNAQYRGRNAAPIRPHKRHRNDNSRPPTTYTLPPTVSALSGLDELSGNINQSHPGNSSGSGQRSQPLPSSSSIIPSQLSSAAHQSFSYRLSDSRLQPLAPSQKNPKSGQLLSSSKSVADALVPFLGRGVGDLLSSSVPSYPIPDRFLTGKQHPQAALVASTGAIKVPTLVSNPSIPRPKSAIAQAVPPRDSIGALLRVAEDAFANAVLCLPWNSFSNPEALRHLLHWHSDKAIQETKFSGQNVGKPTPTQLLPKVPRKVVTEIFESTLQVEQAASDTQSHWPQSFAQYIATTSTHLLEESRALITAGVLDSIKMKEQGQFGSADSRRRPTQVSDDRNADAGLYVPMRCLASTAKEEGVTDRFSLVTMEMEATSKSHQNAIGQLQPRDVVILRPLWVGLDDCANVGAPKPGTPLSSIRFVPLLGLVLSREDAAGRTNSSGNDALNDSYSSAIVKMVACLPSSLELAYFGPSNSNYIGRGSDNWTRSPRSGNVRYVRERHGGEFGGALESNRHVMNGAPLPKKQHMAKSSREWLCVRVTSLMSVFQMYGNLHAAASSPFSGFLFAPHLAKTVHLPLPSPDDSTSSRSSTPASGTTVLPKDTSSVIKPPSIPSQLYEALRRNYDVSQLHVILTASTTGSYECEKIRYGPTGQILRGIANDTANLTSVMGPPGTGKTRVILGILSCLQYTMGGQSSVPPSVVKDAALTTMPKTAALSPEIGSAISASMGTEIAETLSRKSAIPSPSEAVKLVESRVSQPRSRTASFNEGSDPATPPPSIKTLVTTTQSTTHDIFEAIRAPLQGSDTLHTDPALSRALVTKEPDSTTFGNEDIIDLSAEAEEPNNSVVVENLTTIHSEENSCATSSSTDSHSDDSDSSDESTSPIPDSAWLDSKPSSLPSFTSVELQSKRAIAASGLKRSTNPNLARATATSVNRITPKDSPHTGALFRKPLFLLCAPSNAAVDEVVSRLVAPPTTQVGCKTIFSGGLLNAEGKPQKPNVMRIGVGATSSEKPEVVNVAVCNLVQRRMVNLILQHSHANGLSLGPLVPFSAYETNRSLVEQRYPPPPPSVIPTSSRRFGRELTALEHTLHDLRCRIVRLLSSNEMQSGAQHGKDGSRKGTSGNRNSGLQLPSKMALSNLRSEESDLCALIQALGSPIAQAMSVNAAERLRNIALLQLAQEADIIASTLASSVHVATLPYKCLENAPISCMLNTQYTPVHATADVHRGISTIFMNYGDSESLVLEFFASCTFSAFIIDETGQATEAEALTPLRLAYFGYRGSGNIDTGTATQSRIFRGCKKLILVGDPLQLPATVTSLSAASSGLDISLFERISSSGLRPLFLRQQYRMHSSISAFSSKHFYKGIVKDAPFVLEQETASPSFTHICENSILVLDVPWSHEVRGSMKDVQHNAGDWSVRSYSNEGEAYTCLAFVKHYFSRKKQEDPNFGEEIRDATVTKIKPMVGVITPYREQTRSIRNLFRRHLGDLLHYVSISTVDSFQGQETEVVIISSVRSNRREDASIGFLSDTRRLNVAITRAKKSLVLVCNVEHLKRSDANWNALLVHAMETGKYLRMPNPSFATSSSSQMNLDGGHIVHPSDFCCSELNALLINSYPSQR